eukprot:422877-Rhodomonas_salina.1
MPQSSRQRSLTPGPSISLIKALEVGYFPSAVANLAGSEPLRLRSDAADPCPEPAMDGCPRTTCENGIPFSPPVFPITS